MEGQSDDLTEPIGSARHYKCQVEMQQEVCALPMSCILKKLNQDLIRPLDLTMSFQITWRINDIISKKWAKCKNCDISQGKYPVSSINEWHEEKGVEGH